MALTHTPARENVPCPDFSLPATDGRTIGKKDLKAPFLVMFICNHCPYVKAIDDRLITLGRDLREIGVGVVAISSNDANDYPEDSFANMKKRAEEKKYSFPYLHDESQSVAKAFGAEVVLFTTSPSKIEDGMRLGASQVVLSKEPEQMAAHAGSFDFILDAVSAEHDINVYLQLLKREGTMCLVGVPEKPLAVTSLNLVFGRKNLSGSIIGGTEETQEMLDFCGKHGITSDIEMISIQQINDAYERLLKSDVKYRFVIDMASLQQ